MNLPNFRVGDFTVGQPYAIFYPSGNLDFAVFIEMRDGMPVFTKDTDKLIWVTLWEIFEATQSAQSEISLLEHLHTKEQRATMLTLIEEIRNARGVPDYAKTRKGPMPGAEAEEILCWESSFPPSEAIVRGLVIIRALEARIFKHQTGKWPEWAGRLRLAEAVMKNRIHFANLSRPPEAPVQPEPVVEEVVKASPPEWIEILKSPSRAIEPSHPHVDYSRLSPAELTTHLEKELAAYRAGKKN